MTPELKNKVFDKIKDMPDDEFAAKMLAATKSEWFKNLDPIGEECENHLGNEVG